MFRKTLAAAAAAVAITTGAALAPTTASAGDINVTVGFGKPGYHGHHHPGPYGHWHRVRYVKVCHWQKKKVFVKHVGWTWKKVRVCTPRPVYY